MTQEFLAQIGVFLCLLVVIALLSANIIKEQAAERKQKREDAENMRRRRAEISGQSALSRTERLKENLMYNLRVIKMPTNIFGFMEIGAAIIGFFCGKMFLSRFDLALCMAILFAIMPIVYVVVRANWYKQHEAAMLENCMVMITGSYRVTKDIVAAIRDNIDKPNMPTAFKTFLADVQFVDSNVERGLRKVGAAFKNRYFDEWIETLIKAQYDSNMMDILPGIIDEMDEAKKAQNEAAAAMKGVWREYAMWVITVICVPLVLKMNEAWYSALVDTPIGKFLVVLLLAGLVNTMRVMAKISKPIAY